MNWTEVQETMQGIKCITLLPTGVLFLGRKVLASLQTQVISLAFGGKDAGVPSS